MMFKFLQIAEGEESSLSYEEDFVELPIKTELNLEESSEETKDNEFYNEEATENLCGIKVVLKLYSQGISKLFIIWATHPL